MKIIENEFRVRAVTRYVVTHFTSTDYGCDRLSGSCTQYGEFPNIHQADEVAKALHATTPGSTMVTIEERRVPRISIFAYTRQQADILSKFMQSDEWREGFED